MPDSNQVFNFSTGAYEPIRQSLNNTAGTNQTPWMQSTAPFTQASQGPQVGSYTLPSSVTSLWNSPAAASPAPAQAPAPGVTSGRGGPVIGAPRSNVLPSSVTSPAPTPTTPAPSAPAPGAPAPAPTSAGSKYLSIPNGANDQYGFLNDSATNDLARILGGTSVLQGGMQSGTGPFPQANYNQIRMPDGTLIGAGAAQHWIDQYGLDSYRNSLQALQAQNARNGYTDPALNTPESTRYNSIQNSLSGVLANPTNVPPLPQSQINQQYQQAMQQPNVTGNQSQATNYIQQTLGQQQQQQNPNLYGLGSLLSMFGNLGSAAVPQNGTNPLLSLLALMNGGDGFNYSGNRYSLFY